jgi:hypothetical protein
MHAGKSAPKEKKLISSSTLDGQFVSGDGRLIIIANAPSKSVSPEPWAGDLVELPAPKTIATAEAGSKKGHSYRPLPTQFQHHGFDYRQIARESDFAIYEQTWNSCPSPSTCYEVIRIRRHDGFQIGGRFVEPAEIYPNSEAWGVDGWTVQDKEAAFRKLRGIVTSPNTPARSGEKEASCVEKSPA